MMEDRYQSTIKYSVQVSSSGDNTILTAPSSGREYKLRFMQVQNASGVDTTALIKFGSTTVLSVVMPSKGDGEVLPVEDEMSARVGGANALVVNLSGANATWVTVWYETVPTLG